MKKAPLAILALLIALGLFWLRKKQASSVEEDAPVLEQSAQKKKAKDVYGTALDSSNLKARESQRALPTECKDFWDYLMSQSSRQLYSLLQTKQLRWDLACLKIKEPELKQAKDIQANCFEPFKESECSLALNMYRAQVIAYAYLEEKDLSKLDSSVLMNMILAKFANGGFEAEDFEAIKNYSKELLRKEPGLYAAEKSFAGALFIEALHRDPKNIVLSEEMKNALESCRKSNPQDTEIWELSIVPELMKDNLQAALDLANEVERAKPESGLHHYYRAAVMWKQKKKAETLSQLQAALEKEPNNERYKQSFEKVKQMSPGEPGAFSLNLDIGFDDKT